MTCIVGLIDKENNVVNIAGDSAGVSGYSLSVRADEKVFKKGDFVFGFTTSFRMGQILRYNLQIPKYYPDIDIFEYMVKDVIQSIRNVFNSCGYMKVDSNVDSGGTFLVGFKGKLFTIYSDFQVAENIDNYAAVGCGADLALGSLYSTKDNKDIDYRISKALEAASYHSAGVCFPIHVVSEDIEGCSV